MNYRKIISLVALAMLPVAAVWADGKASVVPDGDALRAFAAQTQDYTTLVDNYARGQELAAGDMARLYYGSPFTSHYRHPGNYTSIDQALRGGDYFHALNLAELGLENDPAAMALLSRAYKAACHCDTEHVRRERVALQQRIVQLGDVVFASGKGVVPTSPYVVASVDDIADFITEYLRPTNVAGTSSLGELTAVKVEMEGVPGEVIFYFRVNK